MDSFCLDFNSVVDNGCSQMVSCKAIVCWQAPHVGVYKINTDAALNVQRKCSGLGVIVKDCHGRVMASFCRHLDSCFQPKVVKALAILEGFHLAVNCGLIQAILKSDAFTVV